MMETMAAQAQEWYERANEHRRRSEWAEAINCYAEAERLDPDGPAAEARRMLEDIMNFYCKDYYNP